MEQVQRIVVLSFWVVFIIYLRSLLHYIITDSVELQNDRVITLERMWKEPLMGSFYIGLLSPRARAEN